MIIISLAWIFWTVTSINGANDVICKHPGKLDAEFTSVDIGKRSLITITLDTVNYVTEFRLLRLIQDLQSHSAIYVAYSHDNLTWSLVTVPVGNSTTVKQTFSRGAKVVIFTPPIKARYLAVISDDGERFTKCIVWGCVPPLFSMASFFTGKVKPTYVSKDITVSTRWTVQNSPYVVNGSRVVVRPQVRLHIEDGVSVIFTKPDSELEVQGSIVAEGSADNPIRFIASSPRSFFQLGLWKGINVSGEATFKYVQIYGAKTGVSIYGHSRVSVSYSQIGSCETGVLLSSGGVLQLGKVDLWRNKIGLYVSGNSVMAGLVNCTITGENGDQGIVAENVTDAIIWISESVITGTFNALKATAMLGLTLTTEDCMFLDNGRVEVTGILIRAEFRGTTFKNNFDGLTIDLKSMNSSVNITGCSFTGSLPMIKFTVPFNETFLQANVDSNHFILENITDTPLVMINYANSTTPLQSNFNKSSPSLQFNSNTIKIMNGSYDKPQTSKNVFLPILNYRIKKSIGRAKRCVLTENQFCFVGQSGLPLPKQNEFVAGQSNVIEIASSNLRNSQINIGSNGGSSGIRISGLPGVGLQFRDANTFRNRSGPVNVVNINGNISYIPADQPVRIVLNDGVANIGPTDDRRSRDLAESIKQKVLQKLNKFRLKRLADDLSPSEQDGITNNPISDNEAKGDVDHNVPAGDHNSHEINPITDDPISDKEAEHDVDHNVPAGDHNSQEIRHITDDPISDEDVDHRALHKFESISEPVTEGHVVSENSDHTINSASDFQDREFSKKELKDDHDEHAQEPEIDISQKTTVNPEHITTFENIPDENDYDEFEEEFLDEDVNLREDTGHREPTQTTSAATQQYSENLVEERQDESTTLASNVPYSFDTDEPGNDNFSPASMPVNPDHGIDEITHETESVHDETSVSTSLSQLEHSTDLHVTNERIPEFSTMTQDFSTDLPFSTEISSTLEMLARSEETTEIEVTEITSDIPTTAAAIHDDETHSSEEVSSTETTTTEVASAWTEISPVHFGRAIFNALESIPLKGTEIQSENGFVRGDLKASAEPYLVTKPLVVAEGDLLRLHPGVKLQFENDGKITVRGTIYAVGTPEQWISLEPSGEANFWQGLEIIDQPYTSENGEVFHRKKRSEDFVQSSLAYIKVEGAKNGVFINSTHLPSMHHVTVTNQPMKSEQSQLVGLVIITDSREGINVSEIIVNSSTGIELVSTNGPVSVYNSVVHGSHKNGLEVAAPDSEVVLISDPDIKHSNGTGIIVTSAGHIELRGGVIAHNLLGINSTEKESIAIHNTRIHDNDFGVGISTSGGRIQLVNASFHNNNHHDVFFEFVRNGSDVFLEINGCVFAGSGLETEKDAAVCVGCAPMDVTVASQFFMNVTDSKFNGLNGEGIDIIHPNVNFVMVNCVMTGCNGSTIIIEADVTADVEISSNKMEGNAVRDNQGLVNLNVNKFTTGSCLIENNQINENHGHRIVRVTSVGENTDLHVTFRNNTLKDNAPGEGLNPDSMTVLKLINVHAVVVTHNVFCNPEAACEVRAPALSKTGLHVVLHAKENFWGVKESQHVYDRVCDFTTDSRLSILDVWPSWLDIDLRDGGSMLTHHDLFNEAIGGPLEDDSHVVIAANATVNVHHSIYIPPRSHLTIEPGASLEFQDQRGILVRGEISIQGELTQPVRLGAAAGAFWGGITVIPRDSGSGVQELRLNHVVIDKVGRTPLLIIDPPEEYIVSINSSTFSRSHHCLVIKGTSTIHVTNSTFVDNSGACVVVFDSRHNAIIPSLKVESSVFVEGSGPALVVTLGKNGAGDVDKNGDGELHRLLFVRNTVSGVHDGAAVGVNVTGRIDHLDISHNRFSNNPGGGINVAVSANQIGESAVISENILRNSTPPVDFSGQFRKFEFSRNKISENNLNSSKPVSHLKLYRTEQSSAIIIRDNEFSNNAGETILSIKTECPLSDVSPNSQFIRNEFTNSIGQGVLRLEGACMNINFNKFDNPLAGQDLMVYHAVNRTLNAINNWWGGLPPRVQDIMVVPNARGRSMLTPSLNESRTYCVDRNECSGKGVCTLSDRCDCQVGWTAHDCSVPVCDEVSDCHDQGRCVAPNKCKCVLGWRGDNCGTPDCSKLKECSEHGECIEPNKCICLENFVGADCGRCADGFWGPRCLPCPECKHGECSSTSGVCQCFAGWTGKSCDTCLADHRYGNECRATPIMRISYVEPIRGWHSKLRSVSIFGRNFPNATMYICRFGVSMSIGRWMNSELIECNVPQHADGTVLIQVAPPGLTFTTTKAYFTFDHRSTAASSNASMTLIVLLALVYLGLR